QNAGSNTHESLLPWQREGQNQVAAATASLTATRSDDDELFAVDHVGRRRREDARPGVELPEQVTRLGVERVEIPGDITASADKHEIARGDDRARLAESFLDTAPDEFSCCRVVCREVHLRSASGVRRLIDRVDVEVTGPRAIGHGPV